MKCLLKKTEISMNYNHFLTQDKESLAPLRILQINLDKINVASQQLCGYLETTSLKYHVVLLQEAHNIKHFPKQYKLFPPRHNYSNLPINKKPRASILIHKSLVPSIIHVHDSRDLAIAQFQFQNNICYTASVYLAQ